MHRNVEYLSIGGSALSLCNIIQSTPSFVLLTVPEGMDSEKILNFYVLGTAGNTVAAGAVLLVSSPRSKETSTIGELRQACTLDCLCWKRIGEGPSGGLSVFK